MQSSLPHVIRLDSEQYPRTINAFSYDRIPIVRRESFTVGIRSSMICALCYDE